MLLRKYFRFLLVVFLLEWVLNFVVLSILFKLKYMIFVLFVIKLNGWNCMEIFKLCMFI